MKTYIKLITSLIPSLHLKRRKQKEIYHNAYVAKLTIIQRTTACAKCADMHLTSNCPTSGKIDEVTKCYNYKGNHPASYNDCIIRKQLQQKLHPTFGAKKITDTATPPTQTNKRNSNINNTHSHSFSRRISYADITRNKTQSFTVHDEPTSETSEIN